VDGSVVIVENCLRHLAHAQQRLGRTLSLQERCDLVFAAAKEARQALLFGELIIMVVYLPILTLVGVEGKMFRPMALTVVMALAAAMLMSMTVVPAAVALFVSGKRKPPDGWSQIPVFTALAWGFALASAGSEWGRGFGASQRFIGHTHGSRIYSQPG
jgi:cobalt-zinc-cadmium resistance protein CzcA